ncbi:high frequency lysogenization protein HflD [Kaarinaea lacus]
MQYTVRDRTLALCGIFQAARMVQQIARTGMHEQGAFEASIKSIFTLESATPEAAYEGIDNVAFGARVLLNQLGPKKPESVDARTKEIEVTKYVIGVMVLERKLIKREDLLNIITKGVEKATTQLEHFPITHDNVIANLADIYSQTVSTLQPRIMVNGEQNFVSNTNNANKIRALLLAAIRSAVLWRQCGGNRWQMLFQRKAILAETQKIIDEISSRTLH